MMQYLYIFIGGSIGALLRYWFSFMNPDSGFPTGTFIANIMGSFLMGLLGSLALKYFANNAHLKKGITTGFIGAFTTFSTFQFELVSMLAHQYYLLLVIYAITSYIIGIIVCYIGVRIGGKIA
jgi:CrcB protein